MPDDPPVPASPSAPPSVQGRRPTPVELETIEREMTENFGRDRPRLRRAEDATTATLRMLGRDHEQFLAAHHPFTSSLWLALLKPGTDVLARFRRSVLETPPESSDDPDEARASPPAIIMLGEAMVAKALMGDTGAQNQIAERIEGKVGTRKNDDDPDDAKHRTMVMGAVEGVVRALTSKTRGETIDVTPELRDIVDEAEAQGRTSPGETSDDNQSGNRDDRQRDAGAGRLPRSDDADRGR